MHLSSEQFLRAAALEQHQLRLQQLHRMSAGALYALLNGDPRDAAAWIRSAAEGGLPAAQVRLGRLLLEGQGLPQDRAAALFWFRRAASQRDPDALNMVGRCYERGWGAATDLSQAALSYRFSAEAGYDWGQYNLANLLFDGRGVAQNPSEAFTWYLRAALQGHARAMNLLARCLEEGWGCHRCSAQAAEWFRRSAEAGYFRAQYNHAVELLRRGQRAAAASWLWKAALDGDSGLRRTIMRLLDQQNHDAFGPLGARVQELMARHSD